MRETTGSWSAAVMGRITTASGASANHPAAEDPSEIKINIDSMLPPEQQLAALEQMRAVGAVPDVVYHAAAARIRGTAG